MSVEKKSDSKKHDIHIPIGQKFSSNKSLAVYLKITPPRSGLTWKPMGRIFTQVGLKWIPIRKSIETRYNTNDSDLPLGKETHNPNTVIYANSLSLSAGTSKASEPIYSHGSSNGNILSSTSLMDNLNLTIEEYIRLEEEKARKRGKVFNWQSATNGNIKVDDGLYDLRSMEAEFPAIVINDDFAPQDTLQ
ncbi:hypothetical protein Tco_1045245 [Tanacetum coccineum]|uniref:Uncharacterized protein n=1 Tax=Tanacetum coccineum TaxID=301880 RepID=A0ABQ5GT36_9ASTR